jgi:predicted DNA-binding transcriptional regulator YafY
MKPKPRLHRLLQLMQLLQSGYVLNADALAHRLNIVRRTVFRDLRTLNEVGLTVIFDEARDGYYLPSPWKLPIEPLSLPEAVSLLLICQEIGRADGGMPFHSAAQSAALKISQALPPTLQEFAQESIRGMTIRLDPMNPLAGSMEHYETLLEAWIQRRQVRLEYDSASEQRRIATLFCPYRLVFSRRSWYAVGKSSVDRGAVRVYNIGRVVSVTMLDGIYKIPVRFNLERFLGDAWHLIREPNERHTVVVRFQTMVARNVDEVRWHRTQQTKWLTDGRLEFTVTVDGLNEIQWWILGYGDQAEVVQPPQLRAMIKKRVERLQKLYAE